MDYKKQIIHLLTKYYQDEQKALDWYSKPYFYFTGQYGKTLSPEEMVDQKRGKEVIEWLKHFIQ